MATGSHYYREVLLKPLLLRALNQNQILILSSVGERSITSLLKTLSEERSVPISTLKLNARILRELGLIEYKQFQNSCLTKTGAFVLDVIINDDR